MKQPINDELNIYALTDTATCKVVVKIASDLSKSDGLLEFAKRDEISFLALLPVFKLPGITGKIEWVLKGLGISPKGKYFYSFVSGCRI
jgi:nucleotidyltransferase/DNA polymerase involved in DNA repair